MRTLGLGHVPRVVTSATWHQGPASFRPCALPSSALTVVCMLASHGPEIAAAASELTSACRPGKKGGGEAVREVRFSLKPLAYIPLTELCHLHSQRCKNV